MSTRTAGAFFDIFSVANTSTTAEASFTFPNEPILAVAIQALVADAKMRFVSGGSSWTIHTGASTANNFDPPFEHGARNLAGRTIYFLGDSGGSVNIRVCYGEV